MLSATPRFPDEDSIRIDQPGVSTVIPGARNPRQVETNAAAIDGTLSPDILEKLRTRLGDYNFYQRHGILL